MPLLMPESASGNSGQSASWLRRESENFRLALSLPHARLRSASGALDLYSGVQTSTRYGSAQGISAIAHALILAGLLFLLASNSTKVQRLSPTLIDGLKHPLQFFRPPEPKSGTPSLGLRGAGSGNESERARTGNLPPRSSMPLAPPRLTHSEQVDLPVAPAVLDLNAPSAVPIVMGLGLPWADRDTNSAGTETGHGIGNRPGNGMGDDDGNGEGSGDDGGSYADVVSQPACLYCPEPPYTEEARKAKLQGSITLRALIGADGRARRIQIIKGLGLGLDEQASQVVRGWRFQPARDARRRALPIWVTIETRFQLL
jgi:protein TonB